jgi:broad specificity phosphatase PhoE
VGHKGVNRVILAHFLGLPLEDLFSIEQGYCAISVLRLAPDADGRPQLTVTQMAIGLCC